MRFSSFSVPGSNGDSCPPLSPRRRLDWMVKMGLRQPHGDLPTARLDFADALGDLRSHAAFELQSKIAVTRSLHELWHFREEAFSLISRCHNQAEATRRIASLNRHFG